jgi:hypothetical protein
VHVVGDVGVFSAASDGERRENKQLRRWGGKHLKQNIQQSKEASATT